VIAVRATLVMFVMTTIAACGGAQKALAPPPPLRPKPIEQKAGPVKPASSMTDCPVIDPAKEPAAMMYNQRSIPEAKAVAAEGLTLLQAAEGNSDKATREKDISTAVDKFITALLADPYNVNATYNLAAAYARIDRKQCSVNMLTRLLQMKDHASRKLEVDQKIDRLLGRKKTPIDPDFDDMRNDPRFRELIEKMCEGSADPQCVFGTQQKHP
jgi:hypothetical protein